MKKSVILWVGPNDAWEPKFHDAGTFGGWEKCAQTHPQDSCFISIDFGLPLQLGMEVQCGRVLKVTLLVPTTTVEQWRHSTDACLEKD